MISVQEQATEASTSLARACPDEQDLTPKAQILRLASFGFGGGHHLFVILAPTCAGYIPLVAGVEAESAGRCKWERQLGSGLAGYHKLTELLFLGDNW
ncbi:hypothetical protein ACP70R_010772 [Stipagrostis hirtigluma subsp. patula]